MKLDSNKAWTEATALVKANSDVLWALAGVFFVLPSFAFSVIYPMPEIVPGTAPEAMMAQLQTTFSGALPLASLMIVASMLGTLTVLTLFTDRQRPTVGEAIRIGAGGVVSYVGTQLILIVGVTMISLLVGLLVAGLPLLAVLLIPALLVGMTYLTIRFVLLAPVIAVDRIKNPIAVLQRSWALARGNVARILLFFVLLLVAYVVVSLLIELAFGAILPLLLGTEGGRIGTVLIASLVGSAAQLYFIAVLAAIHRQLSGSASNADIDTFS